jgi:hypothetical protein
MAEGLQDRPPVQRQPQVVGYCDPLLCWWAEALSDGRLVTLAVVEETTIPGAVNRASWLAEGEEYASSNRLFGLVEIAVLLDGKEIARMQGWPILMEVSEELLAFQTGADIYIMDLSGQVLATKADLRDYLLLRNVNRGQALVLSFDRTDSAMVVSSDGVQRIPATFTDWRNAYLENGQVIERTLDYTPFEAQYGSLTPGWETHVGEGVQFFTYYTKTAVAGEEEIDAIVLDQSGQVVMRCPAQMLFHFISPSLVFSLDLETKENHVLLVSEGGTCQKYPDMPVADIYHEDRDQVTLMLYQEDGDPTDPLGSKLSLIRIPKK